MDQGFPRNDPAAHHARQRDTFSHEVDVLDVRERRFSGLRLVLFLVGAVALGNGLWNDAVVSSLGGLVALFAFVVAVVLHLRVLKQRDRALIRVGIHERHLRRLGLGWREFAGAAEPLRGHPYAFDIDLSGSGSLIQRLDVSHTEHGRRLFEGHLTDPPPLPVIRARQGAVAELADMSTFRQELEAQAIEGRGLKDVVKGHDVRLSGAGFLQFARLPSLFAARPVLGYLIFCLPPLTIGAFALGRMGIVPSQAWLLPLTLQALLVMSTQAAVNRAFNLASARQHVVEAFEQMLALVEAQPFQAPLLQEIRARLRVDDATPSAHMGRLRRWVTLGELRQQFLLWAALNPLLLWDLHILRGMERWNRAAGAHVDDWFMALGELEALCSLATLKALEPETTFPEVAPPDQPLCLQGLGHPLLPPGVRVANDVELRGPGTALIVTGSNMAGKSTLLRAVGLNVALALAGGPVCARSGRVPRLRLRASMRAQDNLQEGESYFRAELNKLRSVVDGAEDEPPVLFLLDELLRGTNERARHVGAKAVLLHLLRRRACGLVATHDVALSSLGEHAGVRVENVHFTDVMVDGEMRFDYRLRPGVVRTSNALRLLAMAGIDVPEDADDPQRTLEHQSY